MIDGSTYSGKCACLVGSLAQTRGFASDKLEENTDSSSQAERWFMGIHPGNTPVNCKVARVTEQWIEEWIVAHPEHEPKEWWQLRRKGFVVFDYLTSEDAAIHHQKRVGPSEISKVTA